MANVIISVLAVISIIGAVSRIPGNFQDITPATLAILTGIILIFFCYITGVGTSRIKKYLRRNCKTIIIVLILFTISWQFIILYFLHGNSWWDPGIIEKAAMGQHNWLGKKYFEYYPNTFLLFVIEHFIFEVCGEPNFSGFLMILGTINIVMLDVAFVILVYSTYRIYKNKHITLITAFLSWILMVLSPYFIIFYSDIPSFLISSLFILLYSLISGKTIKLKKRLIYSIALGLLTCLAYYTKPSLVIFDIALGMVVVIKIIDEKRVSKGLIVCVLIVATTFIGSFSAFRLYQHNNSFIKIDKNMAMPMSHFAAIGITGNGSYNAENTAINMKETNPDKRNSKNINCIKKQLKDYGATGYIKFLFAKQIRNTDDATFGWRNEANGYGFLLPNKRYKTGFGLKIQNIYVNNDSSRSWKGLALIGQVIWIITLMGILYSQKYLDYSTQVLKYTIIGGLIFLLIFEGGRSRYLIQFLPYIILLASIGLDKLTKKLNYFE